MGLAGTGYEEITVAGVSGADGVFTEDEFRLFYAQTGRRVWAYLYRLGGDAALADDLLQEAYLRFLRSATAEMTGEHRKNLLYRIATNLLRDHKRRKPAAALVETASAADMAGDVAGRRDVANALARMNPRESEILWLAYVERFSHEEIAGMVGAKTASIRPMLFRARKKLSELLKAYAV